MGGSPTERSRRSSTQHVGLGESEAPGGCPGRDAQHIVGHLDLPMRGEATAGAPTRNQQHPGAC